MMPPRDNGRFIICRWPPERVQLALEMRAKGMNCRQIGAELGTTRNSVLGAFYRAGECKDRGTWRRDMVLWPDDIMVAAARDLAAGMTYRQIGDAMGVTRKTLASAMKRWRKRVMNAKLPARNVEIHDPGRGCRWIDGDPQLPGWSFCGAQVRTLGEPWCAAHRKRVYEIIRPAEVRLPQGLA